MATDPKIRTDHLRRQAKALINLLIWRAGAEPFDPDHLSISGNPFVPRHRRRRFDGHARNAWRQNQRLILLRLPREYLHRGHADDARCNALSGEPQLRSPFAGSAKTYAPFVTPSADAYFSRSMSGNFCLVSTSATGPCSCSTAIRHATAVSFASPGRMTVMSGMARRPESCSIG